MSGTSLDGVDIVYANFILGKEWSFSILASQTVSYSTYWEKKLSELLNSSIEIIIKENESYTCYLAEIILQFIKVNNLFEIGVDRLIVGTAAIKNSHFLNQIKEQNISDRIVFGLDFVNIKNEPMLFVNGWTENTRINIFDYLRTNNWIKNILVTDISKDGTLEGPNLHIYKKLLLDKSLNLIASGGIGGINDISNLIEIGSHECVIGKAIYENKVTLNELINAN